MFQTKNALSNLIARYKSVLAHCKMLNLGLLSCAFALGVSTCISFSENALAVELSGKENYITSNTEYTSVEVITDAKIQVFTQKLTVKDKLTNNGEVYLSSWWDNPSSPTGAIEAHSVDTNGIFTVDNATLTVTTTLNNSGNFTLNGSANNSVSAKNFTNSGTFILNNGTVNIDEKLTNSANFFINNGNLSASLLEHSANVFEINSGMVTIDTIQITGGEFKYQGGTLNATSIENESSFNMSSGVDLNIDTIISKENAIFGVNNSNLTVDSLSNDGNFTINADHGEKSTVTVTKLENKKNGKIQVNGDIASSSVAHLTVKTDSVNHGEYHFTEGAFGTFEAALGNLGTIDLHNTGTTLQVKGDFINGALATNANVAIADAALLHVNGNLHNVNGTILVDNANTKLNIVGDIINGTSNTEAVLHIRTNDTVIPNEYASVVANNVTNNSGLIGIHRGNLTISGILTNNSTSVSHVGDGHDTHEEAIHVHEATLQASALYLNKGGLGLYDDGHGVFTSVYGKSDATLNIWDNGSLTVNRGVLEGTLHINGTGLFTKKGSATDILTISNTITNHGTMKVENGGLVIADLQSGNFTTNGDVIVTGPNSYLQTGDMHQAAIESLVNEGYATAVDAVHTALTMNQATVIFNDGVGIVLATNNDKLIVSNDTVSAPSSSKTVSFDSGTLFKLNGHGFSREDAVITIQNGAGTVNIDGDAKFLATNLTAKTYYTLIKNVTGVTAESIKNTGWWDSVDTGSLDRMIESAEIKYIAANTETEFGTSSTNDIVIVSGGVTDKNFGVDDEIFENMKDLWESGKNDKDSSNAGTGFVSGATDRTEIQDDDEAGKTLESALNVAVTGGVAGMTTDASDIASQAVNHRIDGVRAEAGDYYEDISATDWGLWAIPLYQQSQVRDMKIGVNSGGYDGYITGAIIGLDRKKDEWTGGIAFGLGFGEAESVGSYADTSTRLDFWSAILYGGYHKGNFEIKGDFTYTQTRSEISQDNPYHLVSMSNISADVDSQLYSIGTTVSYRMEGDNIDLTPHIGVRYRAYHQDSFTSSLGGRDLFHVHDGHMETWLLPVGITFSDTFLHNDWLFTPRLDLSYTAVFGDTTIMNRVNIAGTGADVDAFGTANIEADVLDYGFISLSLGCGAKKEDWSFGLDFDFQMSERRQAQGVFARAAYRF